MMMFKNIPDYLKKAQNRLEDSLNSHGSGIGSKKSDQLYIIDKLQLPAEEEAPIQTDLFYRVLRISLLFTGVCFRCYTPSKHITLSQLIRFFFAFAYLVLTTYIMVIMFKFGVLTGIGTYTSSDEGNRTRAMVFWMTFSLLSLWIFFYREIRNQNQLDLEVAFKYRYHFYKSIRRFWPLRMFFFVFPAIWCLRFIGMVIGMSISRGIQKQFITYGIFSAPLNNGFGTFVCTVITIHLLFVLFIPVIFFICIQFPFINYVNRVHWDMGRLGGVGTLRMIDYYHGYRQLLLDYYQIYSHLQFYRVVMMLFSAATALFSFFTFPLAAEGHKWSDFLQVFIEGTMDGLFFLISFVPAAVAWDRLRCLKNLIFFNQQVWYPFDQERYEVAKLYAEMAHITKDNISIIGLEYLTRPLVLTIGVIVCVFLLAFGVVDPRDLLDMLP
ncbi:hypothetical protein M3Y97_01000000 [Aphelenchoides bicaudatus]|nr:hypothetical protein M3Y97_01000000 [Aphelenchoides bicaudatus]